MDFEGIFYGADENTATFQIGTHLWHVDSEDDHGDDNSSWFTEIEPCTGAHFTTPLARVRISGDCDGYEVRDLVDGHIWLEFGTRYYNTYDSSFFFTYTPKETPMKEIVYHFAASDEETINDVMLALMARIEILQNEHQSVLDARELFTTNPPAAHLDITMRALLSEQRTIEKRMESLNSVLAQLGRNAL